MTHVTFLQPRTVLVFATLSVLLSAPVSAQTTKVRGNISDASTGAPVPFVNIVFKITNIGTISDDNGNYFMETRNASDSLVFMLVGYKPQRVKVKKYAFQEINIKMEPINTMLDEITVMPGENPANIILRKILERKKINNQDKMFSYECEVYNKVEFDICNIDSTYKHKRVFRPFQVIFDYIDTSAINGKPYLPVFMSETMSKYYLKKSPRLEREIITASKISGIENESVTQFTGDMYLKTNIYDNYIDIFGKQFISPIANVGLLYYKYLIIDTAKFQGRTAYQVTFKPKSRQEPTFTGNFWVQDSTFAIVKYEMRINDKANINFVNDLVQSNEFELVNDSIWVLKKEQLFVDFRITDKAFGVFGKKTTSYKNCLVNDPHPDDFYSALGMDKTKVLDDALGKSDKFWRESRHEELTPKEQSTYKMMDTLQKVPIFRTYIDLIKMFFSGYKEMKYFEFGPYYTLYSYNEIEAHRFRIGGRTSNNVSKKHMLDGYLAYGTRDNKFKYGFGYTYMFKKLPRKRFNISYKKDLEQLGVSDNAFMQDNIINSILRRNPNEKLTGTEQYKTLVENEWFSGFSNTLSFTRRDMTPSRFVIFDVVDGSDTAQLPHIKTFELGLKTHFAWDEKYVYGEFDRYSMGSNYPIVTFDIGYGIPLSPLGEYEYVKLHFCFDHYLPVGMLGHFNYIFNAGKIFGSLPYPLLELHQGNETYGYDDYAYNLMNYYEFASDKYVSLAIIHHFDGFFFNKIPVFRRLKLREVVSGKAIIGSLSDANKAKLAYTSTLTELRTPYMEAGAGIENILKIFRVDALWRLSYLDHPNISKFGIRLKVVIDF